MGYIGTKLKSRQWYFALTLTRDIVLPRDTNNITCQTRNMICGTLNILQKKIKKLKKNANW